MAPPLPVAEALFRRRLPARFRMAGLIALEAHDHYLKVHTDTGCEMITARFADALDELAPAYGYAMYDLSRSCGAPTFVRSFNYATGPAYGLLLDRLDPGWRTGLRAGQRLDELLAAAVNFHAVALADVATRAPLR